MLNEDLIFRAADMILSRVYHWENTAKKNFAKGEMEIARKHFATAAAYRSAYDILWYAINNNEECLKEFDYYT